MNVDHYLKKENLDLNLKDKIFVITGANSGIGFALAKLYAKYHGKVIFACRNKDRANAAIERILKLYPDFDYDFIYFDQSNQNSIKLFVETLYEKYPNYHSLILNAGILKAAKEEKTNEGLFLINGTNFINLVFLINELTKKNNISKYNHKIIFQGSLMTSFAHYSKNCLLKNNSKGFSSYNVSKLGEESLFYFLYTNNKNININYYLAEPGVCKSNIYHFLPSFLSKIADGFVSIFFHSADKGCLSAFVLSISDKYHILRPRGLLSIRGFPKQYKIRKKVKKYYIGIIKQAKSLL